MKEYFSLLLIIVFCTAGLMADVYIKEKSHRDAFYQGGVTNPAVDSEIEVWIGKNKAVSISANRKIIVDRGAKKIYFINRTAKSYVEAPLPLVAASILDDQSKGVLQSIEFQMEVKPLGQTRKIKDWNCQAYSFIQRVMRGEDRASETELTVWTTEDVSFDQTLAEMLIENQIKLISRDDSLVNEVRKIKGYSILNDIVSWQDGNEIKAQRRIVEISEKTPPASIYQVDEGFEKKEKLSFADLQNVLNN